MNSSLSGTGRPNCHRGHCRNLTLRCQRPLTSLSVSSFPPQSDRSGSEVGHKLFYLRSGSEVSQKCAICVAAVKSVTNCSVSVAAVKSITNCPISVAAVKSITNCSVCVAAVKWRLANLATVLIRTTWLQAGPLAHLPLSVTRYYQFQEEEYH